MGELFSRVDPGLLVPLAAISGTFLFLIAFSVSKAWCQYRKAELAANLKHEMLARGMSAEEIKTVLEAGEKNPLNSRNCG